MRLVLPTVTGYPMQPDRYAICHIGSGIGSVCQVMIAGNQLQLLVQARDSVVDAMRIRGENASVSE